MPLPIVTPYTPRAQRVRMIVDDRRPGPPIPDFHYLDSDVEDEIAEFFLETERTARHPTGASDSFSAAERFEHIISTLRERGGSLHDGPTVAVARPETRGRNRYRHIDSTYDIITEGRQPAEVRHPIAGRRSRQRQPLFQPPYRPAREIPLTVLDACRCDYLGFEVGPHLIARRNTGAGPELLRRHQIELRNHARSQALGEIGTFRAWNNRNLVETRQSRAFLGLDTSEYDVEIARRVLEDPQAWGELGAFMTEVGWVDEADRDGPNYRLE